MALIAQYLFNGNGNDELGNYSAVKAVDVTFEDTPADFTFGQSVAVFNGSTSGFELPNISPIAGTNPKSIEWWQFTSKRQHRETTTSTWRHSFSLGGGDNGTTFSLGVVRGHIENYLPDIDIRGINVQFGTTYIKAEEFHHYVAIAPENATLADCICYVDGKRVSINREVSSADLSQPINPLDQWYSIGFRRQSSSIINNFLDGKIGNLRIYTHLLTEDVIRNHYMNEKKHPGRIDARYRRII